VTQNVAFASLAQVPIRPQLQLRALRIYLIGGVAAYAANWQRMSEAYALKVVADLMLQWC
jgi:hypothetical protein